MDEKRTLTDDDVIAIADQVEKSITERFQRNIGKGVLGLLGKFLIHALVAVAAFGAAGGFKKFV